MVDLKIKTPDGRIGYWHSHWHAGVWLTRVPPGSEGSIRLFPIFVKDISDVLEWEVTDEEPNLK